MLAASIPLVKGLFLIDTMVESVSKTPLRNFVGTLSIEQVEHLMWDTVSCKNIREGGSE